MLDLVDELSNLDMNNSEKLDKINQYIESINNTAVVIFIMDLYCGCTYLPPVEVLENRCQSQSSVILKKLLDDRREIYNILSRITYNLYNSNKKD